MPTEDRRALFTKIAKMEGMGVPRASIADTVGLSESRLSQLMATDEGYKTVAGEVAFAEIEKYQTLNDGWDVVENLAINQVLNQLEMVPDPDYALRAAAMANKAQRRGLHNRPISPVNGQRKTTINLQATFVNKLQQNFKLPDKEAVEANVPAQLERKDTNFLQPSAVEKMLTALQPALQPTAEAVETDVADFEAGLANLSFGQA